MKYICSWKAYFSFNQARSFIKDNKATLETLSKDYTIAICPSFDALAIVGKELKGTGIALGAQNCSAHNPGAYTGQVLALSLKEIGCSYCIIGHSEIRKECQETGLIIAQKAQMLLAQEIIPIICIGESAKEFDLNLGIQVIEQQLEQILMLLKNTKHSFKRIAIGYEPIWAIGDGSTPSLDYLSRQIEAIKRLLKAHVPEFEAEVFYGGSIDELNAAKYKGTPLLDGVMIGHASTDFQKFQKIVIL